MVSKRPPKVRGRRMKQYCRYCGSLLRQDDNIYYCTAKDQFKMQKSVCTANKCTRFKDCVIDAITGKEHVAEVNDGQQISFDRR